MNRARETLDDVVDDIIQQKREKPTENDVISIRLAARDDDGNPLSDEQIRDEAITLIVAGHETTAVSLTYTIYLLAQHPKIEAKIVAELNSVLDGQRPTMTDLSALTYREDCQGIDATLSAGNSEYRRLWKSLQTTTLLGRALSVPSQSQQSDSIS